MTDPPRPVQNLLAQYQRGEIDKPAFLRGAAEAGVSASVAVHLANSVTRPRPGKPYTCKACGCTIGHITPDTLHVTEPGVIVELARLAINIRCPCGRVMVFTARRVEMDVPEAA